MSTTAEPKTELAATSPPQPAAWKPWQYIVLLALAVGVAYWPGLPAPFIFDDHPHLGDKPELLQLDRAFKLMQELRPIGYLSFALNAETTGIAPKALRITNVLIHFGSACLLFWIARRALKRRGNWAAFIRYSNGLAFAIALLWAIHPLSTTAVTYIIQRFESLMSFFLLATIAALWKGARHPRSHASWPWYLLAVICCWLGAGTKEVMIAAPVICLLIDRAFLASSWKEIFRKRWAVYVGLACSWGVVALTHLIGGEGADYASAGIGGSISSWEYLRSQPGVILHYLRLAFWPTPMILDYGWPIANDPWRIYGLGSVILILLGTSIWLCFTHPRIGVIGLSYFLLLALTSTILPIADLAFEHRVYLAQTSVIALTVLAAFTFLQRLPNEKLRNNIAFGGLLVVAALLGFRTYQRNGEFCDITQIWKQSADNNPQNGRAAYNVAGSLAAEKKIDEAIVYYERALELGDIPRGETLASYGRDLMVAHRQEEAERKFDEALLYPPDLLAARLNMAEGFRNLRRLADSKAQLEWVLERYPRNKSALLSMAWLLATAPDESLRDPHRAAVLAEQILKLNKVHTVAILDVASAAFAADGQYARAAELAYQAEAQARPTNPKSADKILARAKLFESGQPYRESEPVRTGPQPKP